MNTTTDKSAITDLTEQTTALRDAINATDAVGYKALDAIIATVTGSHAPPAAERMYRKALDEFYVAAVNLARELDNAVDDATQAEQATGRDDGRISAAEYLSYTDRRDMIGTEHEKNLARIASRLGSQAGITAKEIRDTATGKTAIGWPYMIVSDAYAEYAYR